MTFRPILRVSKDAGKEVGFLLQTGVNHICKINYPGKIPAKAGLRVSDSAMPVSVSLYNDIHRVAFPIVGQSRQPEIGDFGAQ